MPAPAPLELGAYVVDQADLYSIGGIAILLDVGRGTVDGWRNRGRAGVPFPDPDAYKGRRPLWQWGTVARWCARVIDAEL